MQQKVRSQMNRILELVADRGFVPVQQIMTELGMSKSTVNRYLKNLEQEQKIHRMYGGVSVCKNEKKEEPCSSSLLSDQDLIRRRIGSRAAELVEDNDIIFVGTGKTCFELYKNLTAHNLTVFTNSVYCAACRNPNVDHVYILGGEVFEENIVLGSLGIENLSKINPRKIFFSASAINEHFEIQYNYDVERQYIETLLGMEGKKVFLINGAKQKCQSPFKIDCMAEIDAFVTDMDISRTEEKFFRSLETELITV